jgi:outer membrane receptor protein involved in Fe transport
VPATYAPPITVEQSVDGFVGGNPNLNNEESESLTFGVVWQPGFIDNFAIAVDRFDIDLDGAINTVGRQTKANLCYDTVDRQFCGDLVRGSDPAVLGGTVNYVLNSVNDQLSNIATYKISGYDIDLSYAFGLGSLLRSESNLGTLSIKALMTIYDEAEYTPVPGGATIELLDNAGGSTSDQGYVERTANLTLRYNVQSITATWNTRWIGDAKMSPFAPSAAPRVGSHAYHNLRLGWEYKEGSELYVGATNLFDKQPPFFCSGCAGTQALDTIPGFYDIFGRSWYAGAKVQF